MNWEAVIAVVGGISLIFEILLAVWLWVVGAKVGKIDQLEEKLSTRADELIEAKFELVGSRLQTPMVKLETVLDSIIERLDKGDEHFDDQAERAREIEAKVDGVKLWTREHFVAQQDLRDIDNAVKSLQTALSSCQITHRGRAV